MRPPHADGALPAVCRGAGTAAARPSGRKRSGATLSSGTRIAVLAATVLVLALALAAYVSERPGATGPATPATASHGTAFLGTATCANWQAAGVARRLTIIRTLTAAATQPDPENPGATLSQGAAYGLFERACATQPSRSALLYEAYNRAASMTAARMAASAAWGPTAHP
jgi:hypothetical protein